MIVNLGPHISIRTLVEADSDELTLLANDRNIWNFVRDYFPSPYTKNDAEAFIAKCLAQNPQENFGLCYRGKLAGVMGVHPYPAEIRNCAEIGYWIGLEYWSRGIATAGIMWLIEYAFRQFTINRIEASVFSNNPASMRVLLKCGFAEEAIFKDRIIKLEKVLDEHRFVRFRD